MSMIAKRLCKGKENTLALPLHVYTVHSTPLNFDNNNNNNNNIIQVCLMYT